MLPMRKTLIIIQREYLTRVKTKSFLLATIGAPVLFLLLPLSIVLITEYGAKSVTNILVDDQSGLFKEVTFPDKEDGSIYFIRKEMKISSDSAVSSGIFDAAIIIPKDFDLIHTGRSPIRFISQKRIGLADRSHVKEEVSKSANSIVMKQFISDSLLADIQKSVPINFERMGSGDDKSSFIAIASVVGYLVGFLIYMTITIYGTMIMRGVMEEKNNRIMEVLISSVKPWQLMLGKIFGIGAVGLTQFFIWALILVLGNIVLMPILGLTMSGAADPQMMSAGAQPPIDVSEIQQFLNELKNFNFASIGLAFIFYFIFGFFLYGSLFAAIGAAGSDETNAQSLTIPIMMPIMISFFVMISALSNPDGKLAFWGSIIPFSSPIIMPSLMAFDIPGWQIALSVFLIITSIFFVTFVAAKIYRTGVLMYGKKVTVMEIAKWIFK